MTHDVTRTIGMNVVTPETNGVHVPVEGTFRYTPALPFETELKISFQGQEITTWVFARSLLIQGSWKPTGDGDVRVRPATADHGGKPFRSRIHIDLRSHVSCRLTLPFHDLKAWLDETRRVVPYGMESPYFDIDRHLAALFQADEEEASTEGPPGPEEGEIPGTGELRIPARDVARRIGEAIRGARFARLLTAQQAVHTRPPSNREIRPQPSTSDQRLWLPPN
ncbi:MULTISPECIES: SsgA family sporulation/cell division regulator [unclassified Streptomyces]|uniref:SsgA family sporulation/cell division regulator n=1 Tax=Streptomyces sp. NBC_00060 TaxID=2975636 RepID=A0AAU2GTP6_9ACTN